MAPDTVLNCCVHTSMFPICMYVYVGCVGMLYVCVYVRLSESVIFSKEKERVRKKERKKEKRRIYI